MYQYPFEAAASSLCLNQLGFKPWECKWVGTRSLQFLSRNQVRFSIMTIDFI